MPKTRNLIFFPFFGYYFLFNLFQKYLIIYTLHLSNASLLSLFMNVKWGEKFICDSYFYFTRFHQF